MYLQKTSRLGSLIKRNPNFSSMIDQYKHQQLRIGLVSPQQISAWATKILPTGEIVGEVKNHSTFHYKTNKPEKDGLFCERIFGPIKSGICACETSPEIGEKKKRGGRFCKECGVEFVNSRIRRYQMGYIKLACPVTHVWYLKRLPSSIANLLDKPLRELEGLVYCDVMRDGHNQVYKSFSDVIEGKEGRFRETLLGKRVDYSGRSVIVVGPSLSLYQCGLPREIAIEIFQVFIMRGLIRRHLASSTAVAKRLIRKKEPIVWEILQEIMQEHPVLLNRAPTLHKLGIQAFQPVLVEGRAICLHPLVCKGFNADFDGDQMAVHLPFSLEAQAEARFLMFSHMNLLSSAIGDPICVPTQDMLIGLYVLTSGNRRGICVNRSNRWNRRNDQNQRSETNNYKYMKEPFFSNSYGAIGAYRQKRIHLDSPLWLRWRLDQRVIAPRETPIEVHYESLGPYYEIYGHYLLVRSLKKEILVIYIRTTVGHISLYREMEEAIQGFYQVSD
uniref:RNA polymerase beta' subunit n=1 Tax=Incarvillea lutea TaxID=291316 RepID=UPI0021CC7034|nr:RNA polymerase beta' subunit [Incarvillea lutea]UWK23405.1 RNA polymerase beta' subunit [Incarvillea lutea]